MYLCILMYLGKFPSLYYAIMLALQVGPSRYMRYYKQIHTYSHTNLYIPSYMCASTCSRFLDACISANVNTRPSWRPALTKTPFPRERFLCGGRRWHDRTIPCGESGVHYSPLTARTKLSSLFPFLQKRMRNIPIFQESEINEHSNDA